MPFFFLYLVAVSKETMTAKQQFYKVPVLADGGDFDSWLRDVGLWQCVKDLKPKKQAPILCLSLEGQARQCCSVIPVKDLNSNNGVDILIKKLESMYKKDEVQMAFGYYEDLEEFHRPAEMSVVDYINEFDRRYSKIKSMKMELPDGVLAYRLLKSANLSEERQMLCRATIGQLTFENMKKQIKAIFNQVGSSSDSKHPVKVEPSFPVKSDDNSFESTMFVQGNNRDMSHQRTRGGRGRGFHNRHSGRQNYSGNKERVFRRQNPKNKSRNPSRCLIRDSTMHWYKDCPHNNDADDEIQLTMFTKSIHDSCMGDFLVETFNAAVLDSGCSRTVCGKSWLECYTVNPRISAPLE